MTVEEAAKWVSFCRMNGVRRVRTAEIDLDLADYAAPPEEAPTAKEPAVEPVDKATGLTPSQMRDWYEA